MLCFSLKGTSQVNKSKQSIVCVLCFIFLSGEITFYFGVNKIWQDAQSNLISWRKSNLGTEVKIFQEDTLNNLYLWSGTSENILPKKQGTGQTDGSVVKSTRCSSGTWVLAPMVTACDTLFWFPRTVHAYDRRRRKHNTHTYLKL